MEKIKIHVVSFQFPYPANYGGVIDVYYKLKALSDSGFSITLHSYLYDRAFDNSILNIVDHVHIYPRNRKWIDLLSFIPFIVQSRKSSQLLKNLCKDDHPIFFEGLHSCYYLTHKNLQNRIKFFRAHNIEHHYYYRLFLSTSGIVKRLFYLSESVKLFFFERNVNRSSAIFSLSISEKEYFERTYKAVPCYYLPCFFAFDDPQREENDEYVREEYILYHGNLSVEENSMAVLYIGKRIYPFVQQKGIKWIVAGSNPSDSLREEIGTWKNVTLIENPDQEQMSKLLRGAKVTLLVTFQTTGVKLKLLNSLIAGSYCLVNQAMVVGSGLDSFCEITSSDSEMIDKLTLLWAKKSLSFEEKTKRTEEIKKIYNYQPSIKFIKSYCLAYGKNKSDRRD